MTEESKALIEALFEGSSEVTIRCILRSIAANPKISDEVVDIYVMALAKHILFELED